MLGRGDSLLLGGRGGVFWKGALGAGSVRGGELCGTQGEYLGREAGLGGVERCLSGTGDCFRGRDCCCWEGIC